MEAASSGEESVKTLTGGTAAPSVDGDDGKASAETSGAAAEASSDAAGKEAAEASEASEVSSDAAGREAAEASSDAAGKEAAQAAPAAASDGPEERSERTSDGLPSIIIAPEVSEASEPSIQTPGDAKFDDAVAEQFASSYRPSWEAPEPVATRSSQPVARTESQPPVAPADDSMFVPVPGEAQRKRNIRITLGAVIALAAFAVLAVMSSSIDEPAPTAAAAKDVAKPVPGVSEAPKTPPEAPMAAAAPAPAAEPVPVAPVTQFQLSVSTVPPNARLTLDGVAIANPYSGQLPTGGSHILAAQADGHAPVQQTLSLDADRTLTLTLSPEPRPESAASIAKRMASEKKAAKRAKVEAKKQAQYAVKMQAKRAAQKRQKARKSRASKRRVASRKASGRSKRSARSKNNVRVASRPVVQMRPKLDIKPRPKRKTTKKSAGFVTASPY